LRPVNLRSQGATLSLIFLPALALARGPLVAGHFLHDHQALAETLEVVDLALAEEAQRVEDLGVVGHAHQVLVGRPRFLFGRQIFMKIGDGVARTRHIGGGKGHAVGVRGEYAVVVQRVVPAKAGRVQIRQAGAAHALVDHSADHLPVREFFRAL